MELYSSENSDEEEQNRNQIDLSYRSLDTQALHENIEYICAGNEKEKKAENIRTLHIYQNQLVEIPNNVLKFCNLRKLDMSNNRLLQLPECVSTLPLEVLIAKNNNIDEYSLPKSLEKLSHTLENLNLSGNRLTSFPQQIFDLFKLKYLYLGQNGLDEIPAQVHKLSRLEILSLGGNTIREVPSSVCQLHELKALILSSNELEKLPPCIANLKKLRTLQLHKNKLKTLPTEIVRLKYLTELSLRDNPLVAKFINDMVYNPPRLRELSARVIKQYEIPYDNEVLPEILIEYLSSAHHCLNPNCKGVYFDQKVEHIKFVDFCGKYRVPLLQYLCSSKCIDSSAKDSRRYNTNEEASSSRSDMMRKVLLG